MRNFIVLLLSLLFSSTVCAEVFTWKDANGEVHFGDSRNNAQGRESNVRTVTIHDKYAIPPVKDLTPISYKKDQPNRTVDLNEIILGLDNSDSRGIRIGAITCGQAIDYYWRKGVVDLKSPAMAAPAVQTLRKLGYQAEDGVGRPVTPANLALQAKITGLKMNTCPSTYDRSVSQNATFVRILWTLSDPISGEVLFTGYSSGSHDALQKPAIQRGTDISLSKALASATRNLLADPKFVSNLNPVDLNQLTHQFDNKIEVNLTYGSDSGTFSNKVERLKRNSVIVKTKEGHGSGVVINDKGYILTNAHVVGDENTFDIVSGNRTFKGHLIRKEVVRDVALIRVSDAANFLDGVDVADSQPAIGSGLYVIGTPLDLANSQTITKGIVSADRTINGLPFIQTDAAINFGNSGGPVFNENGNLIALTVSGMFTRDGANLSINYLIPINDALNKLAISSIQYKNAVVDALVSTRTVQKTLHTHKSAMPHWLVGIYNWLNTPLVH